MIVTITHFCIHDAVKGSDNFWCETGPLPFLIVATPLLKAKEIIAFLNDPNYQWKLLQQAGYTYVP